jgi:hypothetical protein
MKNHQTKSAVIALGTGTVTSTATVAGTIVDMKGADYATIILTTSAGVNTDAAPVVVKIQESDTTTTSDFTDISTSTMQLSVALSTASGRVAKFHVNNDGTRKRYIRLFATPGTHTTNSPVVLSAVAELSLDVRPSGTTGQADFVAIG